MGVPVPVGFVRNPSNDLKSHLEPSSLPESDSQIEEGSTIDPSYVIHLIRQLLPATSTEPNSESNDRPLIRELSPDCKTPNKPETQVICDATTSGVSNEQLETENGEEEEEDEVGRMSISHEENAQLMDMNEVSQGDVKARNLQIPDGGAQDLNERNVVTGEPIVGGRCDSSRDPESRGEEELREEAGCVLWDLAANQTHADFLVDNHILEVLLAILCLPQSERMREICIGILGNLACHSKAEKAMVTAEGFVSTALQQLQFDDPPILSETCRLLSAGLHSDAASTWGLALKEDEVLERIMWMAANTMNPQLKEKSTELLLAMVDSRREAVLALLPPLMRLGLQELLTDLLECETTAINEGSSSYGDVVLDNVLQISEALSISDEFASQLVTNQKLCSLTCQVIRLSIRDEIGESGITASVLLANLLTEKPNLIQDVSQDETLVGQLFSLLHTISDDPGARNALWSVLGRICQHLVSIRSDPHSNKSFGMIAMLAAGSGNLVDDLNDHQEEDAEEDEERASAWENPTTATSSGRESKHATAGNMSRVLGEWLETQLQSTNPNSELVQIAQRACRSLGSIIMSPDSVMHDKL